MPVSKPRKKHTGAQLRRVREQRQCQERAQRRAAAQEQEDLEKSFLALACFTDDEELMWHAVRKLGELFGDQALSAYEIPDYSPGLMLGRRPGWKRISSGDWWDEGPERWLYVPSIPEGWDERSLAQPTAISYEDGMYSVELARRGHSATGAGCFELNGFGFATMLETIEAQ